MAIKPRDIRKMKPAARKKRLNDLQTELMNLRSRNASGGALESPGRVKSLKRSISRILTVQTEEKLKINQ
ncbi:MAG: 50S ribosomal protein L29 [Promethearchaeota archaeon]